MHNCYFFADCVDTFVMINCDRSLLAVSLMSGHNAMMLYSMYVRT